MKIVNFGSCNIDYVYKVDEIVVPGETKSSESLEIFAGGKGLNQSIATAKAGSNVYHAGFIGKDGTFLKETLNNSGVNTEYLAFCEDKTGHAIIQVSSKAQNSIILYAGANHAFTEENVDEILSHFSKGDFLILQNETNLVDYIINSAYEKGIKILFNPAPFSESLCKIDFNKIDYLVLNEVEIMDLSQKPEPTEALFYLFQKYPRTQIVLTLGSEGCAIIENGKVLKMPPFKVKAVDTTAAGDTFIGFFISEIARGSSVRSAVNIGQAASAIAVTKAGASVSIPDFSEVSEFLKFPRP